MSSMGQHVLDAEISLVEHLNEIASLSKGYMPLDIIRKAVVPKTQLLSTLKRQAQNDQNDIGQLLQIFDRYAYGQSLNPQLMRTQSLRHYGYSNQRRLKHRRKILELTSTPSPPDGEAMTKLALPYLNAADGLVSGYLAEANAFSKGQVADEAAAKEARKRIEDALKAWQDARTTFVEALDNL